MIKYLAIPLAGLLLLSGSSLAFSEPVGGANPFQRKGTQPRTLPTPLLPLKPDARALAPVPKESALPALAPPLLLPPLLEAGSSQLPPPPRTESLPEDEATKAQGTPSPFMSREAIDAQRNACVVTMEGGTTRKLPGSVSDLAIRILHSSGQNCLSAVAVDGTWLHVSLDRFNSEVLLVADENPEPNPRRSWVQISAGMQSFKVLVVQDTVIPKHVQLEDLKVLPKP